MKDGRIPILEFLQTLLHDFGWIHRGIGMIGNLTFVVGSILFLPSFSSLETVGVWLFIGGSALMFIGALGEFVISLPGIRRWEEDRAG